MINVGYMCEVTKAQTFRHSNFFQVFAKLLNNLLGICTFHYGKMNETIENFVCVYAYMV